MQCCKTTEPFMVATAWPWMLPVSCLATESPGTGHTSCSALAPNEYSVITADQSEASRRVVPFNWVFCAQPRYNPCCIIRLWFREVEADASRFLSVQYVVKCSDFFQISIVIASTFQSIIKALTNEWYYCRYVGWQRGEGCEGEGGTNYTIYMMAHDGVRESSGTINTRGVLALAGYSNGHSPPASIKT